MRQGLSGLAQTSFGELAQVHGLGPAKAAEVLAAMELGKRIASLPSDNTRAQVKGASDVANLLLPEMMWLSRESLRVILLNTRGYVLGVREVYNGTVNSVDVRSAEVFREAVRENCKSIIVVHNHPSGDPNPSPEDVRGDKQAGGSGQGAGPPAAGPRHPCARRLREPEGPGAGVFVGPGHNPEARLTGQKAGIHP